MPAWETSIDRALASRLARPLVQPGVIRMALVRRILAGIAALTGRLPLLARFGRSRELAATTRIVHAQWMWSTPEAHATTPPAARPIVHAVPSRTVERSSIPVVTRELPEAVTARSNAPSHAIADGVDLVSGPLASREPPATALLEAGSRARPSSSASVSPASAAAQVGELVAAQGLVGEIVAAPEPRAAMPQSSPDRVRTADPAIRRSRVGAPLPARPRLVARTEGQGPPPTALLVAPPPRALAISRSRAPGRWIELPAGEVGTRATAAASTVLRVRPRAAVAARTAMIADTAGAANLPVVAVKRSAPRPVPALPPIVTPSTGAGSSLAGRRRLPSVTARSGDGDAAHAGELPLAPPLPLAHPSPVAHSAPLAHPSPAAPAAIAALPAAPAPSPTAAPHPVAEAAMPSAPPQKIDLHRLAEQVQRILVRQAAHTRARQGLPR